MLYIVQSFLFNHREVLFTYSSQVKMATYVDIHFAYLNVQSNQMFISHIKNGVVGHASPVQTYYLIPLHKPHICALISCEFLSHDLAMPSGGSS